MKPKKWIKMFCVISMIGMMISTITGCQTNTGEEISEENTSFANNENVESSGNQLQTVPMDACLNLDLEKYTLFDKSLSDWTYEELYDYVYANYEEEHYIEERYDSYTGARIRSFGDGERGGIFIDITEGYSIRITDNVDSYTMTNFDWCRSHWNIKPHNSSVSSTVSSIYGQHIDTYLESICPGLYEKLQEEPVISLKDGAAMMDSLNNGMERISLCVLGGNLELGYQDGVIDSVIIIFTE